ncbi:MAG: Holliday junction resolvase RecU [Limosilactobacillus sp.]|nr:Holliday junction resolvase RecU [Limosilactobacillus sp.]
MAIKYPNGVNPARHTPGGNPQLSTTPSTAKRGMTLESELNQSNQYYVTTGQAVIYKKPTPIQLVKVDYPKRSAAVVKEAYFRRPSTTDYNGVYRGKYLDFDAKETQHLTSFPLKNFHQHQIDHFRRCLKQAGICFAIIRFTKLHQTYLYPATLLIKAWDAQANGARKSIPLSTIQQDGFVIPNRLAPPLDYLVAVDQYLATINLGGSQEVK